MEAEDGVPILDGVEDGEGRDDDLPRREAGEEAVQATEQGERRTTVISFCDAQGPEEEDEEDLFKEEEVSCRFSSPAPGKGVPASASTSYWAYPRADPTSQLVVKLQRRRLEVECKREGSNG